jgi:protease PrsW
MADAPSAAARPRWGFRGSLFQVRQPAFWLFVLLLVGTALYTLLEQYSLASLSAVGWLVSWLLALLFAVPLIVVVYRLDLYEREPLSLVIGALLWGGVVAIGLASIANPGWMGALLRLAGPTFTQEWGAAIVAPVTEETFKGLGVVVLYLIARRELDDVMDGFVYGAMIGLAFAAFENVFYFMMTFAPEPAFGGDVLGRIFTGFFVRAFAGGLYSHVLWSGLVGIAVAYFVTRRGEASAAKRFGVAAGLVAIAIAGHFLWNSPLRDALLPQFPLEGAEYLQVVLALAIKGLPLLAFVVLAVVLARRRERRWLRAALTSEVGMEGLRADELVALEDGGARKRRRSEVAARGGRSAVAMLRRLQRAQINLAMIRTRVDEDDHPDLIAQRRYCAELRARIPAPAETGR